MNVFQIIAFIKGNVFDVHNAVGDINGAQLCAVRKRRARYDTCRFVYSDRGYIIADRSHKVKIRIFLVAEIVCISVLIVFEHRASEEGRKSYRKDRIRKRYRSDVVRFKPKHTDFTDRHALVFGGNDKMFNVHFVCRCYIMAFVIRKCKLNAAFKLNCFCRIGEIVSFGGGNARFRRHKSAR